MVLRKFNFTKIVIFSKKGKKCSVNENVNCYNNIAKSLREHIL